MGSEVHQVFLGTRVSSLLKGLLVSQVVLVQMVYLAYLV